MKAWLTLASDSSDEEIVVWSRKSAVKRDLMKWMPHIEQLLQEGQFRRYYRMEASSFDKLLGLNSNRRNINKQKSCNRTGNIVPISPQNQLQLTISYFAGGATTTFEQLPGYQSHFSIIL
jgi:hypothetical protein